jgi:hypothetical protein
MRITSTFLMKLAFRGEGIEMVFCCLSCRVDSQEMILKPGIWSNGYIYRLHLFGDALRNLLHGHLMNFIY